MMPRSVPRYSARLKGKVSAKAASATRRSSITGWRALATAGTSAYFFWLRTYVVGVGIRLRVSPTSTGELV